MKYTEPKTEQPEKELKKDVSQASYRDFPPVLEIIEATRPWMNRAPGDIENTQLWFRAGTTHLSRPALVHRSHPTDLTSGSQWNPQKPSSPRLGYSAGRWACQRSLCPSARVMPMMQFGMFQDRVKSKGAQKQHCQLQCDIFKIIMPNSGGGSGSITAWRKWWLTEHDWRCVFRTK